MQFSAIITQESLPPFLLPIVLTYPLPWILSPPPPSRSLFFQFGFLSSPQRIHQILSEQVAGERVLPRTGGCSRWSWLTGWLLQSRSLTYLSLLLGREIESALLTMLCYSLLQLHFDSFIRSNRSRTHSRARDRK